MEFGVSYTSINVRSHSVTFGGMLTFCLFWLLPKVCYRKDGGRADCVQTHPIGERDPVLLPHSKWFAASNKSKDAGENSCEEMDSSQCAGE